MTSRSRILILGGSCLIGRHLAERLGKDRVISTYCRTPIPQAIHFDARSMSVADILKEPETVSHAVILLGDTKPESCAADKEKSHALNVGGIIAILQHLHAWRIKPVFASTEAVFDGEKGHYVETDEPHPILTYGKQKVEVERWIRRRFPEYVILRIARVMGDERGDGTLITGWMDAIERGERVSCAPDFICSPVYVGDVAEAAARMVERDLSGIFHVCGPRALSRCELLDLLTERLRGYRIHLPEVIRRRINDFDVRETRPLNISMVPTRLIQTIGVDPTPMEQICDRITRRALNGMEKRITPSVTPA